MSKTGEVALKEFSQFIEVTPMWESYIDEHIRQFSPVFDIISPEKS